ncbi:MAG TPA: SRPBCC family protein, partial [Saprospiraceae bacterium]|nr:SRPBCC family protein [Saprospiraceae bacterium]
MSVKPCFFTDTLEERFSKLNQLKIMDSLLNFQFDKNVGRTERIISAIAGSLLLIHGLRRGKKLSEIPIGSYLLLRGATGYCPVKQKFNLFTSHNGVEHHPQNINIRTSAIINQPREQVYAFWRKLENLPLFMKHLESVTVIDEKTSLWSAKIPGGIGNIDWESEIVDDQMNERIGWHSLPDSEIRNAGNVQFR